MTAMLTPEQLAEIARQCTDEEVQQLYAAWQALRTAEKRSAFQEGLFPDEGPFAREHYPKHMAFFRAGARYRERLFMAGNRVGKTVAGGFETSAHLTGTYREWWEGRRFHSGIEAWVAGDTYETTRDIIQKQLLGDITYEGRNKVFDGTGTIPKERMGALRWRTSVPDLLDYIEIKHETGDWSKLAFKSYDQGRRVFQGTAKHLIWLDEECPMDVYGECLVRTATTNGIVMLTFTPLSGMSDVVRSFVSPEE